jgi:hypothetical protein
MKKHQLRVKKKEEIMMQLMLKRRPTKLLAYPHPLLVNDQLRNDLPHMVLLQRERRGKRHKDGLIKRLVDAYEKKTESSKNSATSTMVDHVREEIAQLLDVVIEYGAAEGSDEHYYATQLLIKKEYRDVFITLKTLT